LRGERAAALHEQQPEPVRQQVLRRVEPLRHPLPQMGEGAGRISTAGVDQQAAGLADIH
jgi:hypothetical protein